MTDHSPSKHFVGAWVQYYKTDFAVTQFTLDFGVLFQGLSDVNPVLIGSCYKGSIIRTSN